MLEKARQAKLLGSSLEARVLLYVEDEQLRSNLRSWNQQPNTADPLRFMFIVSQVVSHIFSQLSQLPNWASACPGDALGGLTKHIIYARPAL